MKKGYDSSGVYGDHTLYYRKDIQCACNWFRRYMGDWIVRLKEEYPDVWGKRVKYLSKVRGLAHREVKDYNRWLFDYCFGDYEWKEVNEYDEKKNAGR